jgi:hypothetical protein
VLIAVLLFCACGPVRFVSAYDEMIDRDATDLHTRIYVFVHRMESLAGKPEGAFESNSAFYADSEGTISTLRLRAKVQEKNEITVKLIQELDDNLHRLRQLHEAEKERGLRRAVAEPALQAIETSCEGIIRFEVAKRRGDDNAGK